MWFDEGGIEFEEPQSTVEESKVYAILFILCIVEHHIISLSNIEDIGLVEEDVLLLCSLNAEYCHFVVLWRYFHKQSTKDIFEQIPFFLELLETH